LRCLLGLVHVLLPHEGMRHAEQTRDDLQRLACKFGCLECSIGSDPRRIRLVLPGEARRGHLVRPGA
jgi:hypothetical protein